MKITSERPQAPAPSTQKLPVPTLISIQPSANNAFAQAQQDGRAAHVVRTGDQQPAVAFAPSVQRNLASAQGQAQTPKTGHSACCDEDNSKAAPASGYAQTPKTGNNNQAKTYTVRRGDTLSKIAAQHNTTWQKLATHNNIKDPNKIFPGQTLKIPGSAPAPAKPPATTKPAPNKPAPAQSTNTVKPSNTSAARPTLREGARGEQVKVLQSRLKQLGFNPGPIDGHFGKQTAATVRSFQRAAGEFVDGIVGPKTWAALDKGKVNAPKPPTAPTPPGTSSSSRLDHYWKTPPVHDYSRTTFRGVTVNKRTAEMLNRAEDIMRTKFGHKNFAFTMTQGSYNGGKVSASAGTHDGGGVVDIHTRTLPKATVDNMTKALREAGFAAWTRGRGFDTMVPHIHAIAIGDRQLSPSARNQIPSYARGRNGLMNQALDPDRHLGRPIPAWAKKLL